uniref:Uncharacterized protein n=1 Tax=viral metagenome TaxID=1070528 RepID=A0A6C0HS05_9ZZZZ
MLLSIDIGIKNLSYCVFENKEIIDWGIIDLSDSEKCSCGNISTFIGTEPYCTKHKPKKSYILTKPIEKMKLIDFKKNKLFQKCNSLEECVSITENLSLLRNNKKNASTIDLIQVSRNIQKQFDIKWKDTLFDVVIIENQISPLASRMKTIQGMVTQYFVKTVPWIQYISSSNKLKHVKTKMTYQERKKEGIKQCEEGLTEKWRDFFSKTDKKDDLADCYLQGIWFIANKLENIK